MLDLVSGGRMRLTVGLGYREEEYRQFEVNIKRRPSLMEEAVETLKLAWTGEPFEFRGETVRDPAPTGPASPTGIAMGGASPASARRAARIADDYQPLAPRLYEIYLEELATLGQPAPAEAPLWMGRGVYVYVAEDPERAWARIAPWALHDTNEYARWIGGRRGTFEPVADAETLRQTGTYRVVHAGRVCGSGGRAWGPDLQAPGRRVGSRHRVGGVAALRRQGAAPAGPTSARRWTAGLVAAGRRPAYHRRRRRPPGVVPGPTVGRSQEGAGAWTTTRSRSGTCCSRWSIPIPGSRWPTTAGTSGTISTPGA